MKNGRHGFYLRPAAISTILDRLRLKKGAARLPRASSLTSKKLEKRPGTKGDDIVPGQAVIRDKPKASGEGTFTVQPSCIPMSEVYGDKAERRWNPPFILHL
ncbi:hypothetical protein [Pararhizobium gei]|uniref:hypothetical protein n=1 Tax=Pararhizobium gei TaxID=1395951 RepID=UPI0023DA4519|nr:hypothetical protein [Rhizobium gei]